MVQSPLHVVHRMYRDELSDRIAAFRPDIVTELRGFQLGSIDTIRNYWIGNSP